jgi:hypothetical protein
LQVRVKDTMPASIGADVVRVLHFRREALERGALVTIDKSHSRVRVLPIGSGSEPGEPAQHRFATDVALAFARTTLLKPVTVGRTRAARAAGAQAHP